MGEWALRTACRDAAAGNIPGTVAVNLSPVQFASRRSRRKHPRDPAGDRTVAAAARGRGHGIDGDVGPDPRPAYPAQAESDGHFDRDGRFWHRLFVAGDAACVSIRQDQTRPVFRASSPEATLRRQLSSAPCSRLAKASTFRSLPKASRPWRSGSSWRVQLAPRVRVICSRGPRALAHLPAVIDAADRFVRDEDPAITLAARAVASEYIRCSQPLHGISSPQSSTSGHRRRCS